MASKQSTLFDIWENKEGDTFEDGWKNKLIWGDNLWVMGSLLEKFSGNIDLIYIDPPFATGADFSFKTQIGDGALDIVKKQSIIEEKAYRDTWGKGTDSFIAMIYERLSLMHDLLADDGSIYVHCDWRVNYYLRNILDEIFGRSRFINEIAWHYPSMSNTNRFFPRKHDTILFYTKSDNYIFNARNEEVREKYKEGTITRSKYAAGFNNDRENYLKSDTKLADTVWEIPHLKGRENVGYPTQKPSKMLERIISASSNECDLVADFFCGSGTTLAVAEKLGRRWIGCDLGRFAIHTTRKRLLDIEGCNPFEILNLGKYERQYWQGVTFGEQGKHVTEQALYEYLAFILKLYGAQPVPGLTHLHGKKGKALVHIGAVDAPVTIDEINTALASANNSGRPSSTFWAGSGKWGCMT